MITESEYEVARARLMELLDFDPPRGSPEDEEILLLADKMEIRERYNLRPPFGERRD